MQTTFDIHTPPAEPTKWVQAVAYADSLEGANPRHGYVKALVSRSMR